MRESKSQLFIIKQQQASFSWAFHCGFSSKQINLATFTTFIKQCEQTFFGITKDTRQK